MRGNFPAPPNFRVPFTFTFSPTIREPETERHSMEVPPAICHENTGLAWPVSELMTWLNCWEGKQVLKLPILSLHSCHFLFLLAKWEKCKKWGRAKWEQKTRRRGRGGEGKDGLLIVDAEQHLIKCLRLAMYLLSSTPPLLIFCWFPPNALYSCFFLTCNPLCW